MQPLTTVFISIQAVKAPVLHGAGNQRRPNIARPGHDMYQISVESDIYRIYQVHIPGTACLEAFVSMDDGPFLHCQCKKCNASVFFYVI